MTDRPNLFIIGAPKSGTTSLYEYLAGHPQVFMAPIKEPFYFCPDVRIGLRPRLEHPADESRYLRLFAAAGGALRRGEATTRYLVSAAAPELIGAFQPDAQIVVSLREPVAMMAALHSQRVSGGNEDITDFEQALAADDDRRHGRRLPPGSNARGAVYRDNARYGELLEPWLEQFGRDRVHIIIFDELAAQPAATFARLLSFLGVDPSYEPRTFDVRNPRHRQRRTVRAVADSRLGRLVSVRIATAVLGEDRRARLAGTLRRSRVGRRTVPPEPIATHVRNALQRELASDVARLSELIGR
ncbi:MAG: sulfotransferase, partial [Candidatus Limnocylindrales bacterium]